MVFGSHLFSVFIHVHLLGVSWVLCMVLGTRCANVKKCKCALQSSDQSDRTQKLDITHEALRAVIQTGTE